VTAAAAKATPVRGAAAAAVGKSVALAVGLSAPPDQAAPLLLLPMLLGRSAAAAVVSHPLAASTACPVAPGILLLPLLHSLTAAPAVAQSWAACLRILLHGAHQERQQQQQQPVPAGQLG
jgi:hypothetical protein